MNKHTIDFLSPISVIPKIGDKRVAAFKEVDIVTIEDLLFYLPRAYLDKTNPTEFTELESVIGSTTAIVGSIASIKSAPYTKGKKIPSIVTITDTCGQSVNLVWYQGFNYIKQSISIGVEIFAIGKISYYNGYQISHPIIEIVAQSTTPIEPRYSIRAPFKEARIGQKIIQDSIRWILKNCIHFPVILPEQLEAKYALPSLQDSLQLIHFPKDLAHFDSYMQRIKTEELYTYALQLRWRNRSYELPGIAHTSATYSQQFIQSLPYELTLDQQKVLTEIALCTSSKQRLHGLLQGDVGCGKTVTAFIAALSALEEGYQVLWIAPTELLAQQTYSTIQEWLTLFDIVPRLLTGSTIANEKRSIIRELALGSCQFVIGTHALIQKGISFTRLGFAVIDEQHRFGAQQRAHLQSLGPNADILMLTATPIPQSLAHTLFSDLQLFTITTLPANRLKILSKLVPPSKEQDLILYIASNFKIFTKVFWVVPRIVSTEEDTSFLATITSRHKKLISMGVDPSNIIVLHGQLSSKERIIRLYNFAKGPAQFLISTTVIEVGIHIPAATVMVIENAEQFGLAQLHQIRGRVGRSNIQSYAYLLYSPTIQPASFERLERFLKAGNGFEIADLDLELRGTGEILGTGQSGNSELKYSNILKELDHFKDIQMYLKETML